MRPTLIALATAWGPRFGGINTFNTELLKSLGIYQGRGFEVACVLPRVSAEEAKDAQDSCSLTLLGLNRPDDEFDPATLNHDLKQILAARGWQHPIWLGHDDKTGPLALQLRDALGGRAALVHHMAHGAYQGFKKGSSVSAGEKAEHQRQWFRQADVCLAVGPRLLKELRLLLSTIPHAPPTHPLMPGLTDLEKDHEVVCLASPPEYFTGFTAGRLDDDNIKQGRLALRAFAYLL